MAGKRQHYIPRFLQRGFLAEDIGNAELTWLHRRGAAARRVSIKDVGVGEFFYSKLPKAGEETLDDLITALELDINSSIKEIRNAPLGDISDPKIPARITAHLSLRTAHVRMIFQKTTAQILDHISAFAAQPDHLRTLMGIDNAEMTLALATIDKELSSSPLGELIPLPLARRVFAFNLRESFNEFHELHLPMLGDAFNTLIKSLPAITQDSHNDALKKFQETQWEADLAQLSWRTHRVVGAILPDCIALAQTGTDALTPLLLRENQIPNLIILPISHDLLLVGTTKGESLKLDIKDINAASASCSESFFVSTCDSSDLTDLIGQHSPSAIEKIVLDALDGLSPGEFSAAGSLAGVSWSPLPDQPSSFSYSFVFQGFANNETVTKLNDLVKGVIQEISRVLPLSMLDGITFSSDYAAALENLDRGDATLKADRSHPRAYGRAVAKSVHVLRDGKRKNHIVMDESIAGALLDSDNEVKSTALHVIVGMLAHVAHTAIYEQRLLAIPEVQADLITKRMHSASAACPGMYFAARASSFTDSSAGERAATLVLDSLLSAQQEIRNAKQAYLKDRSIDELLDTALLHVSAILNHAAEWLGHQDGAPTQYSLPEYSLPERLRAQELHNWLELFGLDLRKLYGADDNFTPENIMGLSRHVERLLWSMGIFPWPTEGGDLYVSVLSNEQCP